MSDLVLSMAPKKLTAVGLLRVIRSGQQQASGELVGHEESPSLPGVDGRTRAGDGPVQVEGRRCRRRDSLEGEGGDHAEVAAAGASQGVEGCLLEGDGGAPVFELEGGDLVVEEGAVLDQAYHRREGVVEGGLVVEVLGAP
ncbi:MAG: hypothetical protein M3Q62_07815 [Actinomycetota bacterium]|nr:hypothetical protein [Actinomycetota bacterium]MDQ3496098.1 hypothetical protein [Actinomycetota bacterium]